MPVSYPLSFSTLKAPRSVSFRQRSVVGVDESPFSLQQQSYAWSGQRWEADIALPPMSRPDAEAWVAALVSLNGREGSFLLGDRANATPRGTATGTPLVKGGSQTGYDLITDGWTAGVTGIIKAGDWIQLGSGSSARLYKAVADANSNGSGEATLTLWPRLRSSPADNAALVVAAAVGKFMLSEPIEWNIDEIKIYGIGFRAVEDLRP